MVLYEIWEAVSRMESTGIGGACMHSDTSTACVEGANSDGTVRDRGEITMYIKSLF